MNVLLIRPERADTHLDHENKKLKPFRDAHQPIGLLYLATMLKNASINVFICDEHVHDNVQKMITEVNPDIIGITVTSPLLPRATQITKKAKSLGIKVILGGPHISALPKESLADTGADVAVIGEGEYTLLELCQQSDWKKIKGIALQTNNTISLNPPRQAISDLDALPFIQRDLVALEKYKYDTELGFILQPNETMFRIFATRGCPYHCTTCASHNIFGHQYRNRSPQNIIEEIKEIISKWNVKNFTFIDDDFTLNKSFLHEFCSLLIAEKIQIQWVCLARIGIESKTFTLMKKAGCQMIGFGVESGSNKILEGINKQITTQDAIHTFHKANKIGIKTRTFFIVGLPGETNEDFKESIQLAYKLKPTFLWAAIFLPLPGSILFKKLSKQKDFTIDWNDPNSYFYSSNPLLQERHRKFIRAYYLRIGYLMIIAKHLSWLNIKYFFLLFTAYISLKLKNKI